MSVIDGGITYGCSDDLENRAYGIAFAAQDLERVLRGGGSLPKEYTIAGQVYRVVRITGVVADGKTNNQTALAAAVSASRGGKPTLLVLPPASDYYRYSSQLDLSENTYLVGYGANVKPLGNRGTAWRPASNSGIFGLHMHGLDSTYSKWLERHELLTGPAYRAEGAKDGSVAATGNNSDDTWVRAFGLSNVILMDIQTRGGLTAAFWSTSQNMLIENCSTYRCHSDSFHITKQSANVTVRRCRAQWGGDDGFSMIQYDDSVGGARPSNILIDQCEMNGSRARGFTAVSAKDVLFLDCLATQINLAPYMAATAGAHSTAHCEGVKFVRCEGWRGSKMQKAATFSAGFLTLFSSGSHSWGVLDTEVRDCKGRWFTNGNRPDWYSTAIRTTQSAGTVQAPIQSGNDFATINSAD